MDSVAKHIQKEGYKSIEINIWHLLFIIIAIACVVYIVKWINGNRKNENIINDLSSVIVVLEEGQVVEGNKIEKYDIDFKALNEKNKDTKAWLKVRGTNIEYPVVQSSNNSYYIDRNFQGEYNYAGWIFADYRNKVDGTDKNLVIYGHNIKDGSMFGSLKNILTEEWQEKEENKYIILETEEESQVYEVFSVYQIEAEEYYLKTNFNTEEEFENFINTIKQRSVKNFETEVTAQDKILTLSTCANNNKYRVVLHAKKMQIE